MSSLGKTCIIRHINMVFKAAWKLWLFQCLNPQDESLEGSSKLQRPDRICLICGDCERRSREVTTSLKSKPSLGRKRKLQTGSPEVNANPSVLTAHLLWRDKVMRLLSLDLMSSSRFWLSLPFSANHRSPLFPGDDIPTCFSARRPGVSQWVGSTLQLWSHARKRWRRWA